MITTKSDRGKRDRRAKGVRGGEQSTSYRPGLPSYCQIIVGWNLDRILTFPSFGLIKKEKKIKRCDGKPRIRLSLWYLAASC